MEARDNNIKVLRLPEVMERVGLRRSSIYNYMADGIFPKAIPLGLRARGWLESEIENWITSRSLER